MYVTLAVGLLAVLGLVVGTISMTVTKAVVFKWFRDRLKRPWLKELFSCPYCFSHWVATAPSPGRAAALPSG